MIKITFLSGNETFLSRPIDHYTLAEVLRKADEIYTIYDNDDLVTQPHIAYLLHQAAADWVRRTFPGYELKGLACACPPADRHGETSVMACNECGLRLGTT
jgi:hypothetical protein